MEFRRLIETHCLADNRGAQLLFALRAPYILTNLLVLTLLYGQRSSAGGATCDVTT